jgi:hypothetical protein
MERIEVDGSLAGKIFGKEGCVIRDIQKRANCTLTKLRNVSLSMGVFECRANHIKDLMLARLLVSAIICRGPLSMNIPHHIEEAARVLAKQHPSPAHSWEAVATAAVAAIPDADKDVSVTVDLLQLEEMKRKEKEEREAKEKEEREASKVAKEQERLARAAEEARLQAEKELLARAEKEATERAQLQSLSVAARVVATGLRGESLWNHVASLDATGGRPSGSALLAEVLTLHASKGMLPAESGWWRPGEYGTTLRKLLNGGEEEEVQVLNAVQLYCSSLSFPSGLLEKLFTILHSSGLVDKYSFVAWEDSDEEVVGKCTALIQCTSFLAQRKTEIQIEEEEEQDEAEEDVGDEDEDIGVWRPLKR